MKLTVVVENQTCSQRLLAEWGYCAWLETPEAVVMLDTGGINHTLMHNMPALALNPRRINHLVLSHGHFDHTAGLLEVLRTAPQAKVWAAPSIGRERLGDANAKRPAGGGSMIAGLDFSPIDPFVEITPGVTAFTVPIERRDPRWICTKNMFEKNESGQIVPDTFADDVSILVQTEKGASVLLGCAHAGVPNILRFARETFGIRDTELSVTLDVNNIFNQQYEVVKWYPMPGTNFKITLGYSF